MTIEQSYKYCVQKLKLAGIKSAELDVQVLLKFVLQKDDVFLVLEPQMPLTNYQQSKLNRLISRRLGGEPVAYLTKHKEFFGYDFYVDNRVLVPRPESELLVEQAIQRIRNYESRIMDQTNPATRRSSRQIHDSVFRVLDLGTGSGCLIISLAKELEKLSTLNFEPLTEFFASDISSAALQVAKRNAKNHEIDNKIKFFRSDLFSNRLLHKKYDAIIANLPYVPLGTSSGVTERRSDGVLHEPQGAIFADDNGAAVIKKFLTEAKNYLAKDSLILIELDPRNAYEIKKSAEKIYINRNIELSKDLAGLERYLTIAQ